jgi:SAM-dependent methyltransferase
VLVKEIVMRKELPVSYYTGQGYLRKGKFELYLPLYKEASMLLPDPTTDPKILDLGCGVGFFAKVLYDSGYKNYMGIDFSAKIINHAKKQAPHYTYKVENLYSPSAKKIISRYKIFTALETLEHIEGDIEILKSIPKGSTLIASLPSGLSKGHVRAFSGPDAVRSRYNKLFTFDFMKVITLNPKKKSIVTIFRGERK